MLLDLLILTVGGGPGCVSGSVISDQDDVTLTPSPLMHATDPLCRSPADWSSLPHPLHPELHLSGHEVCIVYSITVTDSF